ncbi:MAG TPA: nuclear transport factor 2 family protein [Solirubrobacterales bacterium]|jgi:hypothetical protein|nr:nuclear transport factor 2 family protein [Solirubrobacterales bacterium]
MSTDPAAPTAALRAAMEARDANAALATFAPDARVNSPLTDRLVFVGHEQLRLLLPVILDVFRDIRYTEEAAAGHTGFLVWEASIGGRPIEAVDQIRFGADGLIEEMTVFFRPLPVAAAALRAIGAGLGRNRSPGYGTMVGALAAPLGAMAGVGDRVGVGLIRGAL